jgi:hypothetical protein
MQGPDLWLGTIIPPREKLGAIHIDPVAAPRCAGEGVGLFGVAAGRHLAGVRSTMTLPSMRARSATFAAVPGSR